MRPSGSYSEQHSLSADTGGRAPYWMKQSRVKSALLSLSLSFVFVSGKEKERKKKKRRKEEEEKEREKRNMEKALSWWCMLQFVIHNVVVTSHHRAKRKRYKAKKAIPLPDRTSHLATSPKGWNASLMSSDVTFRLKRPMKREVIEK